MPHFNEKPALAIDCATTTASIALRLGEAIHARSIAHGEQAAQLVPAIDALLKEHRVAYADLGCLLTTLGPGSFTGLRIALATVHALALALAIPVRAITALESIAWDVAADFSVALNAGKGEVFVQRFSFDGAPKPLSEIQLVSPEWMEAHPPCYGNMPPAIPATPQAATLCRIGAQLPELPLAQVMPLYIRPPDAKPGTLPPWLQASGLTESGLESDIPSA